MVFYIVYYDLYLERVAGLENNFAIRLQFTPFFLIILNGHNGGEQKFEHSRYKIKGGIQ